jgi:hypothetical protein
MLHYLFQGYADTIVLATTLRPSPSKPAPTIRESCSAREFVEAPGGRASSNCTKESAAAGRLPLQWFAHWPRSR